MTSNSLLTIRRQVAELLVVRASGHSFDIQRNYPLWEVRNKELNQLLEEGLGGVIFLGGSSKELQDRCQRLQKLAKTPLLLCADVEEGFGQRFHGGTWFVPPMALAQIYRKDPIKAIQFAENYARSTGYQARRIGLNWVLAPVCDVNSNSHNPVINVRAWGEDPHTVADLICAFHRGLASEGVLSCAKHFPGHGDTHIDSHLDLPAIDHDLRRLEEFELVPFKAAISAGISSVMTAHLLIPKIDSENPATLSNKLINKVLRKQLKFEGLVVTDALVMRAISQNYGPGEAAVLAFAAGADLILMPESPYQAIDAISESLLSGRVPMERLWKALERRRDAIAKISSFVPSKDKNTFTVIEELERPKDCSLARELVTSSLDVRHPCSIKVTTAGVNLLRIDEVISGSGIPLINQNSPAICLPEAMGYRTVVCHQMGVSPWKENSKAPLAIERLGTGPVLLQLFIRGNPFRANADRREPWLSAVHQLQNKNLLAALVVYGSQYLWQELIEILHKSIPAAYSPGQMNEAQHQALDSLIDSAEHTKKLDKALRQEFTN